MRVVEGIVAIAVLLVSTVPAQRVLRVPSAQYQTLPAAILAAESLDTIALGAGRFPSPLTITKNVTIVGGGRALSIIDASVRVSNGAVVRLTDLAVANDYGISCTRSTLEMTRCDIVNNRTGSCCGTGGGIDAVSSNLTLINCRVANNLARDQTTAWFSATAQGGGISVLGGSMLLDSCEIVGNTCDATADPQFGVATAEGGGVYCEGAVGRIENCLIAGNWAVASGAFTTVRGGAIAGKTTVRSCTIIRNDGPWITNTPAIHGTHMIVNSIVRGNPVPLSGLNNTVSFSNIEGGAPGTGNFDADPRFVSPGRDYHLTWGSPCRDRGANAAAQGLTRDIDGDPRIVDGTVDVGADEFYTRLVYTGRALAGWVVTVRIWSKPGERAFWAFGPLLPSPITLNGVQGQLRIDPLRAGIIDLDRVPSSGEIAIPITVPSYAVGYDIPMQALVANQLSALHTIRIRRGP